MKNLGGTELLDAAVRIGRIKAAWAAVRGRYQDRVLRRLVQGQARNKREEYIGCECVGDGEGSSGEG